MDDDDDGDGKSSDSSENDSPKDRRAKKSSSSEKPKERRRRTVSVEKRKRRSPSPLRKSPGMEKSYDKKTTSFLKYSRVPLSGSRLTGSYCISCYEASLLFKKNILLMIDRSTKKKFSGQKRLQSEEE